MSRQISRDPFARTSLYAERVYHVDACQWCGSVKQTQDATRSYLFRFETRTDGGRAYEVPGLFCSVDCMRTYHA